LALPGSIADQELMRTAQASGIAVMRTVPSGLSTRRAYTLGGPAPTPAWLDSQAAVIVAASAHREDRALAERLVGIATRQSGKSFSLPAKLTPRRALVLRPGCQPGLIDLAPEETTPY
jgi:hypothetical protein